MKLEFLSPNQRLADRECRSKLLHPGSQLYRYLERCRAVLESRFPVASKRMDFHLELAHSPQEADLVTERAQKLEGRDLPLSFVPVKKAFCLAGPVVPGYGPTHITIAYFPQGMPVGENLATLMPSLD